MGAPTLQALAHAEADPSSESALRIQILGPLRLWRGGVELDTGPRQQTYLLALLLAHEGIPLSKSELVGLIWGDSAPHSAVNVIHKYVGALRRLLEPTMPHRGASSYLLRRADSYLCTAGAETLDLKTFRDLVGSAQSALGSGRHEEACERYERALRLWHGSAADGMIPTPEALSIFAGLNDEFFSACTAAADLAVRVGRPEPVLPALHLAASIGPLHEPVQASLITTLGAADRQAEALSVYHTVRTRLAEDLGIDPGSALELAYDRVLRQDFVPSTDSQVTTSNGVGAVPTGAAQRVPQMRDVMVGRAAERAVSRDTLAMVRDGGTGLVVVEGEPGAGKTRLLEEVAGEAENLGCLVVWGRCLDGEGVPPMWPWTQIVRAILDGMTPTEQEACLAGALSQLLEPHDDVLTGQALPGDSNQFRLFEQVVALISQVSVRRPLVIAVDDLQWADVASLHLFAHLASRQMPGTLVLAALREGAPEPGSHLGRTLASVSRSSVHRRLHLGPLGSEDVAELVRRETGQAPDPEVAHIIQTRTDGNPFFVQEVARLISGGGPLTGDTAWRDLVPASVRDVVRDRMAGLDDSTKTLLEIAALIGREVDLNLLAHVADLDVAACLAGLEPVQARGLLVPSPGNPSSVRFVHDLVRESLNEMTPPRHATRLHLRVADALELMASDGESVPERVAHHLWAAGPLAQPARTAAALVRSGRRAASKSALETAEQQLRLAAQVSRTAGLADAELAALYELTAVIGMRSMYAGTEAELLERAEHLARKLGREVEAAGILYSRWASYAQGIRLDRTGPLAQQLLKLGESSPHPIVQTYGLQAWGIHQWDVGNIGEAFRYLSRSEQTLLAAWASREENPVQYDLQLLMSGMQAETTTLHGREAEGRALLDRLEAAGDDRYTVTVWATMSARIAVILGDPTMALAAADRGIAADPDYSYVFLGTYQRLARCWGRAVTGDHPARAAEEAQEIIETKLCDPVRSCVSVWYTLLAEMRLAAGELQLAAAALDRAEHYLRTYGQRYGEGLLLLLRARLLHAQGRPAAIVRAAAQTARQVSIDQEAHLFVGRTETFLAQLDEPSSDVP